jgi:hypothetical protein
MTASLKIDVYCMARNEILLMPYFLKHYETFASNIYVWDDHSTDGTRELLKRHHLVHLIEMPFLGLDDNYSRMNFYPQYIERSRGKADWVIQVDADEFLYHKNILDYLNTKKAAKIELLYTEGWLMTSEQLPSSRGQLYDEVKTGIRDHYTDKPIVFDPRLEIVFDRGRHGLDICRRSSFDLHFSQSVNIEKQSELKLLHFRYFGVDYFINRIKYDMERMWASGSEAGKKKWPYDENKAGKMPDKGFGKPREWCATHIPQAVQVVD